MVRNKNNHLKKRNFFRETTGDLEKCERAEIINLEFKKCWFCGENPKRQIYDIQIIVILRENVRKRPIKQVTEMLRKDNKGLHPFL